MLKEIYSRDVAAPKFNVNTIEVSDELSQLILKIENVLFTRKGDVLGAPEMGCNLDDLIFSLVFNEGVIAEKIMTQISGYCLNGLSARFGVNVEVEFYTTPERDGCIVDIFINEERVLGALF